MVGSAKPGEIKNSTPGVGLKFWNPLAWRDKKLDPSYFFLVGVPPWAGHGNLLDLLVPGNGKILADYVEEERRKHIIPELM